MNQFDLNEQDMYSKIVLKFTETAEFQCQKLQDLDNEILKKIVTEHHEIPDKIVNPLILPLLTNDGYVIDGYPRTDLQAYALKAVN